jgi:hypothetical protein
MSVCHLGHVMLEKGIEFRDVHGAIVIVSHGWQCPTCETALRDTLNVMAGHREWADIVNENRIDPDQIAAERTLFDVLLRLTLAIVDGNAVTVQPNEAKAILTAVEG